MGDRFCSWCNGAGTDGIDPCCGCGGSGLEDSLCRDCGLDDRDCECAPDSVDDYDLNDARYEELTEQFDGRRRG